MKSLDVNNLVVSGGANLSIFTKNNHENDVPSKSHGTIQKVALAIIAILALAIAIASGIAACILCQPLLGILTGASAGIALLCLGSLLCHRKQAPTPESPSPVPEVAPTPEPAVSHLGFPTHDVLLSKNWDRKRDLNEVLPNATLANPNQRCNIWKLTSGFGKSSIILIDTEGDITIPRVNIENASIMFVNAANPDMSPGGGGTNAAFTKAVTDGCWGSSKQSINAINPKPNLEVGECRSGKWEGRDESHRFGNGHFFAQLLGPRASECNNDWERAHRECRRAYIRCFCEAKRNKANVVQVPLISSGIYAPTSGEDQDKWLQAVRSALIRAAQDFSEVQGNDLIIVLTGIQGPQLAQD